MLINYTKGLSSGQLSNGDWEEFCDEFVYEVDFDEVNKALNHILKNLSKEELVQMILQFDGEYVDLETFLKDELTEYFREEAMKSVR